MTWMPLYDSVMQVTQNVRNTGSTLIYPKWEITGPGYYVTLNNLTTGKNFNLRADIRYGDMVTVDFDPTQRRTYATYESQIIGVDTGSEYWPLVVGNNQIYIEIGRTTARTRVKLIRVPQAA